MAQTKRITVTVETTYEVSGAEPVQLDYRKSQIIPERAVVTTVDGKWVEVKVMGPVAKKDGTPGASHNETEFRRDYTWDKRERPAWLIAIAEECEVRS